MISATPFDKSLRCYWWDPNAAVGAGRRRRKKSRNKRLSQSLDGTTADDALAALDRSTSSLPDLAQEYFIALERLQEQEREVRRNHMIANHERKTTAHAQKENAALKQRVRVLQQQQGRHLRALSKLKIRVNDLEGDKRRLLKQRRRIQGPESDVAKRLAQLTGGLGDLQRVHERTAKELDRQAKLRERAEREAKELRQRLAAAKEELDARREDLDRAREAFAEDKVALEVQKVELASERAGLLARADEQERVNRKLKEELQSQKDENRRLHTDVAVATARAQHFESDMLASQGEVRRQLSVATLNIAELRHKLAEANLDLHRVTSEKEEERRLRFLERYQSRGALPPAPVEA